ncbi:MAG: hypothetical protein HQL31_07025 [Planctomycetes bacterium]|nr:hypothetical protein [Planctomycetota bacterium]
MSNSTKGWPVLKRYDHGHSSHIAMPIGGIGTGTVSLGGRGDLRDWEVANRPAKGFNPYGEKDGPAFFVMHAETASGHKWTKLLEGPVPLDEYEGAFGCRSAWHGMPRFRDSEFLTAYPFAQVVLRDKKLPFDVSLMAFNPLVPPDADKSGIPMAQIRFRIKNTAAESAVVSVCGSLPNFIGADPRKNAHSFQGEALPVGMKDNINVFRDDGGLRGLAMSSPGVDPKDPYWGTLALASPWEGELTHRTSWGGAKQWNLGRLDFWDDFSSDGRLDPKVDAPSESCPMASLCLRGKLEAGEERDFIFLIAWHFPNRITWTPTDQETCACKGACDADNIGNYYSRTYADAWDVLLRSLRELESLETETLDFVSAFVDSDLPLSLKEAALFNLSTLRSQTCFRTPDGFLYGYEGSCDREGCCHGSCTHVWNYELATPFLFGSLARGMREVEFLYATREDGLMNFRVNLPLERAGSYGRAAADGQMGCIMKLYREWKLCGDNAWLAKLWPAARKALEFCWLEGGWDADRDGVMEGCQHNTMDVEYFGPNPQMGIWYLGALRAASEMAIQLGEEKFSTECQQLFERGSKWIEKHLFNGEYYRHELRLPGKEAYIHEGLQCGWSGTRPDSEDFQLIDGCLVDQLVGQFMAHVCGLGHLVDRQQILTTLGSILKYNQREDFFDHFNCFRSYVLGDERALVMAGYPEGRRPKVPFPYFSEVMTGFEYCAGIHMLCEGMVEEGLGCIDDIRARYDGRKRNPFNEAECGHHYARAMASWGGVQALSGFSYSGKSGVMEMAFREGSTFWASGDAWGTCDMRKSGEVCAVELRLISGSIGLNRFCLQGYSSHDLQSTTRLQAPQTIAFSLTR